MIDPKKVKNEGYEPYLLYGNSTTSYSIALLKCKDGAHKLGFRWNGNESDDALGTPTSHGNPTWMYIPENFLEKLGVALDSIRKEYKPTMGKETDFPQG